MSEQVSPPSAAASPAPLAPDPAAPLAFGDLLAHFQRGCKASEERRIGLEHEKIGVVLTPDGRVLPLPYAAESGPAEIRTLFAGLQARGWLPSSEGGVDGAVIALKRNRASVTLEPGGQFELSGAPQLTDVAAVAELDAHIAELLPLADAAGVAFLGCGFRPLGTWADVPWVPKGRYAIMREYLPTRGSLGVEMMKRTATVQANLDYTSEADAMAKLRMSIALGPFVTALFAASPLVDGKPGGYQSFRAACWLDTDPDRCGTLPFVFRDGASFADYAEWALDVPLFFIYRHKRYITAPGVTFRRFMAEGYAGERATLADWELHLSTLFPDTRLKQYVEMRTADAGPLSTVRALASLWRGWLYDAEAERAATALVSPYSHAEIAELRTAVPRQGLAAKLRGQPIAALCRELVDIARAGLSRIADAQSLALLEPLQAYAAAGRCPADDILDAFHAAAGDPRRFAEAIRLRP
jgi:glutamate--cysteine ligase